MRRVCGLGILGYLVCCRGAALSQDSAKTAPSTAPPPATAGENASAEAKLLATVREALERNAQEIKSLKEQYARDMAEQKKKVAAQQQQIQLLEQTARKLQEQIRASPAGDRQQKIAQLQQKQLGVLEEQSQLIADQLEQKAAVVDKLQTQTATLESRAGQAAERDRKAAAAIDQLTDALDNQRRNTPNLPPQLKSWFLPSGTDSTPVSMFSTFDVYYNLYPNRRGAGEFAFDQYTPFFLYQLNRRMLLSAEVTFNLSGATLGQAQLDMFINDWLTVDIGYFLAPVGFISERLDPVWINKLPDLPLAAYQVIPDGLALTGVQMRGAKYLFGSPIKMEYSGYMTNGLGVPGQGQVADWYDLGGVLGTSSSVNEAMAYGARLGFWYPAMGINLGVSEFVNAPYSASSGAVMSIWQPYFNYHRGNWDYRFEYGDNYEATRQFIGNNIHREGFYSQIAYRDYRSIQKHRQRLEYVFRFSEARFQGIDQASVTASAFDPPSTAPVNRNQYTFGLNYYIYASTVLKFAYEFNQEINKSFNDNVFMIQFATNF